MDPTSVLFGAVLLFAVYPVVVGVIARYLAASGRGEGDRGHREEQVDPEAETVTCSECGAENDRGYTYCQRCIAELPGAPARSRSVATPNRRGIV